MRSQLSACLFACLASGLIHQPVAAQGTYPVAVGDVHPDFQLLDVNNSSPVSLSGFRDKKVLLIHFASW